MSQFNFYISSYVKPEAKCYKLLNATIRLLESFNVKNITYENVVLLSNSVITLNISNWEYSYNYGSPLNFSSENSISISGNTELKMIKSLINKHSTKYKLNVLLNV